MSDAKPDPIVASRAEHRREKVDLSRRSERYKRFMQQLKIRDEESRIVPMVFSPSQNLIWQTVAPDLDEGNRLWYIVLKSRQVYATTLFEGLTFARTMEAPNVNSLVIAQDLDSSIEIFGMVKRFYDYLAIPKDKPPKARELLIPMKGGTSRFKVVSAGVAAKGRGTTQTCIHCSEAAFWEHSEVMTGLSQAMPDLPNTLWVVESTANGMIGKGEMFYKMWKAASKPHAKMKQIFIPWYFMTKYRDNPSLDESEWDDEERLLVEQFHQFGLDGRSLRWRRGVIASKLSNSVEMFHQEYPSTPEEAFISSGLPAFDSLSILAQQQNIVPPKLTGTMNNGKFEPDRDGEVFLWDLPREQRQYVIGVDTAEGIRGGDYACGQIIRMDNMEQVGIIHGLLQPYEFSGLLNSVGRWFNNAIVCVEVNNTGHAVQDYLLRKWMYPRLHPWRGQANQITNVIHLWGWKTNVHSRPLLIEAGRRAINTRLAIIHDSETLMEIKHFTRQDTGKYEAEEGHDDRVMALLMALRSREENYSGATRMLDIAVSSPDLRGIRVIDMDTARMTPARMLAARTKIAKERAALAAKSWMQL